MSAKIDWNEIVRAINVNLEGGLVVVKFNCNGAITRLDLLSNGLGIGFLKSPDQCRSSYSMAGLLRIYDENQITIVPPPNLNLREFIGVKIYHVEQETISRRFYF